MIWFNHNISIQVSTPSKSSIIFQLFLFNKILVNFNRNSIVIFIRVTLEITTYLVIGQQNENRPTLRIIYLLLLICFSLFTFRAFVEWVSEFNYLELLWVVLRVSWSTGMELEDRLRYNLAATLKVANSCLKDFQV